MINESLNRLGLLNTEAFILKSLNILDGLYVLYLINSLINDLPQKNLEKKLFSIFMVCVKTIFYFFS